MPCSIDVQFQSTPVLHNVFYSNVRIGPKADNGKVVSYVRIVPEGEVARVA